MIDLYLPPKPAVILPRPAIITPAEARGIKFDPPFDPALAGAFSAGSGHGARATQSPKVVSSALSAVAGSTSRVLNLPASYRESDLIAVAMGTYNSNEGGNTYSTPSGWTQLVNRANGWRIYVWYKFATGSEGATLTVNRSNGDTSNVEAISVAIRGADEATAPEKSDAEGNAGICVPPAISPSWGKGRRSLFLTFNIWESTATAYSPGYRSLDDDRVYGGAYSKAKRTDAETPGAMAGTNGNWVAATVAVCGLN